MDLADVKTYVKYYEQQGGGGDAPEMYRGVRRWGTLEQTGGSDNPVRTLLGTFGPALAHGAATFLANTATGYADGDGLGDAARKAIAPAIMTAMRSIGKRGSSSQDGSGRRRRAGHRQQRKKRQPPQLGGSSNSRRGGARRSGYKRGRRSAPKHKKATRRGGVSSTFNF